MFVRGWRANLFTIFQGPFRLPLATKELDWTNSRGQFFTEESQFASLVLEEGSGIADTCVALGESTIDQDFTNLSSSSLENQLNLAAF